MTSPAAVPTLVAVAHGTHNPSGAENIDALLDQVRALRPELRVEVAYVEITPPSLPKLLGTLGGHAVVVPLLLGNGFHLVHDVAAVAGPTPVAPALGPHPLIVRALADRLREAGACGRGPVVLASAGSSDSQSRADAQTVARRLELRLGRRVLPAYASAATPRVTDAVQVLRSAGARRVEVATYLLSPGRFATEVAECGADVVSDPLGAHDAVARLVLRRYDAARAGIHVVRTPRALQAV
jgi:sirohydrochlorin ferrochelatase